MRAVVEQELPIAHEAPGEDDCGETFELIEVARAERRRLAGVFMGGPHRLLRLATLPLPSAEADEQRQHH
jgi:hypothetical protein